MQFPKINNAWNKGVKYIKIHSPQILLGSGLATGAAALYFTVDGTIKAVRAVDSKDEKIPGKEIVKMVWKYYIPAFLSAGVSAACFIGSNHIHATRNAALTAAYSTVNSALWEYKNKVRDQIGEKEEQKVREKILEDKIKQNPITDLNVDIIDPHGTIIYDELSDKYLKVDLERVYAATAAISRNMFYDTVPVNEYYDLIGWKYQEIGKVYGWPDSADGLTYHKTSVVAENGDAVLAFEFDPPPIVGYDIHER